MCYPRGNCGRHLWLPVYAARYTKREMPATKTTRQTILLVDGHAVLHRGLHALPELTVSRSGEPTGAVYGFTSMLLKGLKDYRPTHTAVAFDHPAPTFRHEQYEAYKAQRPASPPILRSQLERVKELCEAMGIPIFELAGYEADDLLGALADQAVAQGIDVIIATGDADTFQLVGPSVQVLMSRQGLADVVLYDEAAVQKRYGFSPDRIPDYKALRGDPSDNLPGLPGVGDKTASKLLQEFGSVEGIYENIELVAPAKLRDLIRSREAEVRHAKVLATIVRELPVTLDLEAARVGRIDASDVMALFKELEFGSLVQRLVEVIPAAAGETLRGDYRLITDLASLEAFAGELAAAPVVAVDTETTSENPHYGKLVGISFSTASGSAAYVPIGHAEAPGLPADVALARLKPLLEDERLAKVVHNGKFDLLFLARAGIDLKPIVFDTRLAAYLLGEKSINLDLKGLAFNELKLEMTRIGKLIGTGRDRITMAEVPLTEAADYACADADVTLRLQPVLAAKLKEQGLEEVFERIEMPLLPVLGEMERHGIAVDSALLAEMGRSLRADLARAESAVYNAVGHAFNINSPVQLGQILFEELRLPHARRTKSGYSTDASILEGLRSVHPVIEPLLEYRQISKLLSTYIDALQALINPETGRIHTSFNQIGSETGRVSSNEPNVQNIPVRTERGLQIRRAFIAHDHDPSEQWLLLSADYSQIELRVLAHLSKDEALIAAFQRDEDIHAATAARLYGVPMDAVTSDMRRLAKAVNFGVIYGMNFYGLAQRTELSTEEASVFIKAYFETYPGVRAYLDATKEQARQRGYVETLFGRRRHLPELRSNQATVRQAAERKAINMPVQGTAADVLKLAMINTHDRLHASRLQARLLLTVHDELLFEAPAGEIEDLQELAVAAMSETYKLNVPLKVDVRVGPTWGDLS